MNLKEFKKTASKTLTNWSMLTATFQAAYKCTGAGQRHWAWARRGQINTSTQSFFSLCYLLQNIRVAWVKYKEKHDNWDLRISKEKSSKCSYENHRLSLMGRWQLVGGWGLETFNHIIFLKLGNSYGASISLPLLTLNLHVTYDMHWLTLSYLGLICLCYKARKYAFSFEKCKTFVCWMHLTLGDRSGERCDIKFFLTQNPLRRR